MVFLPLTIHLLVKLTTCLIGWPSSFRKSLAHFTHLTSVGMSDKENHTMKYRNNFTGVSRGNSISIDINLFPFPPSRVNLPRALRESAINVFLTFVAFKSFLFYSWIESGTTKLRSLHTVVDSHTACTYILNSSRLLLKRVHDFPKLAEWYECFKSEANASVQIQCHRTNRNSKPETETERYTLTAFGPGTRWTEDTYTNNCYWNDSDCHPAMVTKHKLLSKVNPLYIAKVMLKNIQATPDNSNLLGKLKKAWGAIKEYRAMDHGKVKAGLAQRTMGRLGVFLVAFPVIPCAETHWVRGSQVINNFIISFPSQLNCVIFLN